jgi:hypothetical protein
MFVAPPAQPASEVADPIEHRVHLRHHVLAVDEDGAVAAVAERDVQHRALLGDVDLVAGEHPVALLLHPLLTGKRKEKPQRLGGDSMFRIVDEQIGEPLREAIEALRILREERAHLHIAHLFVVLLQRDPGGAVGRHGDLLPRLSAPLREAPRTTSKLH